MVYILSSEPLGLTMFPTSGVSRHSQGRSVKFDMPINSLIDKYLLFGLTKQRQVHSTSSSEAGTIAVLSFNREPRQFVIHVLTVRMRKGTNRLTNGQLRPGSISPIPPGDPLSIVAYSSDSNREKFKVASICRPMEIEYPPHHACLGVGCQLGEHVHYGHQMKPVNQEEANNANTFPVELLLPVYS